MKFISLSNPVSVSYVSFLCDLEDSQTKVLWHCRVVLQVGPTDVSRLQSVSHLAKVTPLSQCILQGQDASVVHRWLPHWNHQFCREVF